MPNLIGTSSFVEHPVLFIDPHQRLRFFFPSPLASSSPSDSPFAVPYPLPVSSVTPFRSPCCSVSRSPHVPTSFRVLSLLLSTTNCISHPYRTSESVPSGPECPKTFHATNLTVSSVMLTGIKIGILSYIFNVSQEINCLLQMFSFQDRCDVFVNIARKILCQFVRSQNSPISHAHKNWTASHNFFSAWGF